MGSIRPGPVRGHRRRGDGRTLGGRSAGPAGRALPVPHRRGGVLGAALPRRWCRARPRSEEPTSELQSRFDLVCRLLLVKKKSLYRFRPTGCIEAVTTGLTDASILTAVRSRGIDDIIDDVVHSCSW